MPTLQGKAVFLKPIRQSRCAKPVQQQQCVCLLILKGIAAPSLPFGCSATLRSLSHRMQLIRHSSRQLLCPSCHFIHFVLCAATLHHVRTLTMCYKAWHTSLTTKQSTSGAHTFSQAHATILTGSHSAPLRPTFISVAFSPPAAYNFFWPHLNISSYCLRIWNV